MKRIITILLSALLVLSLSDCSGVPSDEKIKAALEDGTITIEDAKSKGWIDDEWIEANFKPIEAESKIYIFDPFETTYLDGTPASSKIISGRMCLVFFNTSEESTMNKIKAFNEICEEMKTIGVPVLGIVTDDDLDAAKEKLTDIRFPIIVYNKKMEKSLTDYNELIGKDLVSIFTKDGGFYSAWNNSNDTDDLLTFAQRLADEE